MGFQAVVGRTRDRGKLFILEDVYWELRGEVES